MTHAATKPSQARQLEPPRFENGKALLIAGLRSDYTPESMNDLPVQWQRLVPHLGKIPGQIGRTAYGVSWCPENSPDPHDDPGKRRISSSATPNNSIRAPEWAEWKSGYRSNAKGIS